MGFLRVKTVKEHEYVYWCTRIRSRKKHGGSGKVKSPDLLIGRSIINGKYLAFYLYTEEVPLFEYADAVVSYLLDIWSSPRAGTIPKMKDAVIVEIDWQTKQPKIQMRTAHKFIDCRSQFWRGVKRDLQHYVQFIYQSKGRVTKDIELAAYCLAKYTLFTQKAQSYRDKLQRHRRNPDETWMKWESVRDEETGKWQQEEVTYHWVENAAQILDEGIVACDKSASKYWDVYQKTLNRALDYAPRQRQEEFKRIVATQIEKLAKDDRWVERYEVCSSN